MAKTSKPKATPTVSATDALMRDVMKKQEIAKAVIISRAADFTGKSGSETAATAAAPSAPRAAARRKPAASPSPSIERRSALAGSEASGSGVRAALLPPAQRVSLRAPAASLSALSKALGLNLPANPKTSTSDDGRTALWLGPDEWLVIDEAGGDSLADCAKVKALHSAVDVSHRNVAILVSGAACEAALSSGCPQDSVALRLSGRRLLAHDFGQGRNRSSADRRRRVPRGVLAFVLRLCLRLPRRRGA